MKRWSSLLVLLSVISTVLCSGDDGPGDPEFSPNDGELENAVNPLRAPEGNYNIATEKGVYVLNRDTFAHFVKPKDLVLVEFYAPECVHCKELEKGNLSFINLNLIYPFSSCIPQDFFVRLSVCFPSLVFFIYVEHNQTKVF
jgi:thiol-disulfide isomerase/thioredoxin